LQAYSYRASRRTSAALEEERRAIRAQRVSINKEEYHLGLIGVAVPVRRSDGTVVTALAVHAPSPRMPVDVALSYVFFVRACADEIAFDPARTGNKPSSALVELMVRLPQLKSSGAEKFVSTVHPAECEAHSTKVGSALLRMAKQGSSPAGGDRSWKPPASPWSVSERSNSR
jgi:Bacterial transcriptional regulator